MKSLLSLALIATLTGGALAQNAETKSLSLFNGTDLSGWVAPENNIWWKVVDGAIVCQNGPEKKGSNLWTEEAFTDFILEAEFKFDGTGDKITSITIHDDTSDLFESQKDHIEHWNSILD